MNALAIAAIALVSVGVLGAFLVVLGASKWRRIHGERDDW